VQEDWLRELFPGDFREAEEVVFDPTLRRVVAERQKRFRDLVLAAERGDHPPPDEAARILAREVASGRCVLKNWNDAVEQWILRVNRLRGWMPELALPEIRAEDRFALLEQICYGATSYKEIKDRAVWPVVKGWLSSPQQEQVAEYTPERLELPGGRKAKVTYAATGAPSVSVRIQDLYGVREGLRVVRRTVPVVIEVLAPNQRPVQVTQNLASFWTETYPKIKQELQRKYPKHEWR
jgi:ATP-dependent helicase HrpB